ncbi:unnamed protein product [Didymodactylos carnosus]|nr:unnamed protein product [Didymodactylos carnosus]CAF4277934.1 unnamed protein product [Didymodactylos carnosus]
MYSQLIKDILIGMEHTDEAKREMIQFCRQQYEENDGELRCINEFERDYRPSKAIWWYTRESFLYRILNKALRIQDIDVLYKLRFFIADLHKQLHAGVSMGSVSRYTQHCSHKLEPFSNE